MILLVTFNAKYPHASLALRYLKANLDEPSEILELTIDERPADAVEKILARNPRIVGFSVYIWNAVVSLEAVRILKRVAPHVKVVLGGPEVSYESQDQEIVQLADHTVLQEGERVFPEICRGEITQKIVPGGQLPVDDLKLPYPLYSEHDLQQRIVYVEASRGCPFRCEFCLSSLDKSVRHFDVDVLLGHLGEMLDKGARHVKFIDRTFNLKLDISRKILQFCLDRYESGMFFHFEMIPDRFPEELRSLAKAFPAGALQFEVGIQTFDDEVSKTISRRQDIARLEDNLRFLTAETGVHIHADLIVGLPGEDLESFGRGFDRLVRLNPQEIQVGILKRLRGTPIVRHTDLIYSPTPPYEVLATPHVPFAEMQRLKRFARYWELVGNRGQFPRTLTLLLGEQPFANFLSFSDWVFATTRATSGISLVRLAELLGRYLEEVARVPFVAMAEAVGLDYAGDGQRYLPPFLLERAELPEHLKQLPKDLRKKAMPAIPKRQARQLAQR